LIDCGYLSGIATILIAIVFPVAYTIATRPVDYDGVRHFLFVIPLLSVVCALTLVKLIQWVRSRAVTALLLGLTLASMALTVFDLVRLHPYQYVYFNRLLAGGVRSAAERFETDYWGSSYKEAVEWIVENYTSPLANAAPTKVASCLHAQSTSYYLPGDRFQYIGSVHDGRRIPEDQEPDLFLAHPRWGCDTTYVGRVLHTVEIGGATLSSIVEVGPSSP
jgi:hypothetical protein